MTKRYTFKVLAGPEEFVGKMTETNCNENEIAQYLLDSIGIDLQFVNNMEVSNITDKVDVLSCNDAGTPIVFLVTEV